MNAKRLLMLCAAVSLAVSAQATTCTREEFRIRDPFVPPENGTYYLCASTPESGGNVRIRTFDVK